MNTDSPNNHRFGNTWTFSLLTLGVPSGLAIYLGVWASPFYGGILGVFNLVWWLVMIQEFQQTFRVSEEEMVVYRPLGKRKKIIPFKDLQRVKISPTRFGILLVFEYPDAPNVNAVVSLNLGQIQKMLTCLAQHYLVFDDPYHWGYRKYGIFLPRRIDLVEEFQPEKEREPQIGPANRAILGYNRRVKLENAFAKIYAEKLSLRDGIAYLIDQGASKVEMQKVIAHYFSLTGMDSIKVIQKVQSF